jgi:hypothetical protein
MVAIEDSAPSTGWLSVAIPGSPVAMDSHEEDIWILTGGGLVMRWNSSQGRWSSLDAASLSQTAASAMDVAALDNGAALLTPRAVLVIRDGSCSEHVFTEGHTPMAMVSDGNGVSVLMADGGVLRASEDGMSTLVHPAGKVPSGCFSAGVDQLAWLNTDTTATTYTFSTGLTADVPVPRGTESVGHSGGVLITGAVAAVHEYTGQGCWEPLSEGILIGEGLVLRDDGIFSLNGQSLTSGLPMAPSDVALMEDGTVWSLTENGLAVWASIGEVDTRLPEADVMRLDFRMAGQTSGGAGSGTGVASAGVSMGGVFRIYESVSSRPDPFTEFPATRRDLRRTLEDLTIEELHLVGITLDPSGGDLAMVEDANGVAYVLREGTTLRNNTHIAEITGNEVIIVQEVTVGSEDDPGGVTVIPTIFSMRLHEEGGL